MPPFERDASVTHPVDFLLAANGPVQLFWSGEVLNQTSDSLAALGYDLVVVDASGWSNEANMHENLAMALNFPDYYGANMNALDDCLGDVADYAYAASATATGFALVMGHYDAFTLADPWAAQRLLDSFARAAHRAALIGHRMLCLVQSGDPRISFEPVGAFPVSWNPQEWLDESRGV